MNRRVLSGIVSIVMLCAMLLPSATHGQDISATPLRLRIGVTEDGITVLRPADLSAAGVDLATVDPRTFALSSLGQSVAILVTGEQDGHFDTEDRVYFFGQKFRGPEMDQKYTDERVYWLTMGGAAGLRMTNVDAAPVGDLTPPTDFPVTLRAEQSTQWWTLHRLGADTQDTWFWARLQPPLGIGQVITASLPYTVPFPAPGIPAVLRLEEHSRAGTSSAAPDHRTTVTLNGTPLLDQSWDGMHVRKVFSMAVPANLLQSGTNTVRVGAWNMPGVASDDVYANYWELDYRRQFIAWKGRIDFTVETAGLHEYVVDGWTSSDVAIWDVSDPIQPKQLLLAYDNHVLLPLVFGRAAAAVSEEPGAAPAVDSRVRFRVSAPAGARYWLQDRATLHAPASVRLRGDTGLRAPSGGADAVILTSALLRPAAERLADWHRGHDRRALVVDVQDVYDEFNEGIYHPKAVSAMLVWARTHWAAPAPAFLTLVGDGHWNFKGYNPVLYPPVPNHIPPYLAWVDPWQGEVPADALYGDLDGDMVPEVAVGRLAVNTLAEAQTVVDKIVNYDENVRAADWQRKALFVADNPDPAAGDFPLVSDEIIASHTPGDLTVIKAYLSLSSSTPTQAEILATRNTISSTLQSGVWLVQYAGHGAIPLWAGEGIWQVSDVAGLRNGPRLPVVMTFNCLDGYFAHPAQPSVAETMQRHAGGGSIAAFSPSGLGLTTDQHAFRVLLLDVMFKENVRELGAALTQAKREFFQLYGSNYMIQTMTLFGDPALRMPGPAAQ